MSQFNHMQQLGLRVLRAARPLTERVPTPKAMTKLSMSLERLRVTPSSSDASHAPLTSREASHSAPVRVMPSSLHSRLTQPPSLHPYCAYATLSSVNPASMQPHSLMSTAPTFTPSTSDAAVIASSPPLSKRQRKRLMAAAAASEIKSKDHIDKSIAQSAELNAYLEKYGSRVPEVVKHLRIATFEKMKPTALMLLDMSSSVYLSWLATEMKARRILEVGTFTGSTSLHLALTVAGNATSAKSKGSSDSSKTVEESNFNLRDKQALTNRLLDRAHPELVITLDIDSSSLQDVGLPFWNQAIDDLKPQGSESSSILYFKKGSAIESMEAMVSALSLADETTKQQMSFDMVFIDADKNNYKNYYELALQLLRPGGVIAMDNMLWKGRVVHFDSSLWSADNPMTPEERANYADDNRTKSLHELNEFVHNDPRVSMCLLPLGDGILLATKL